MVPCIVFECRWRLHANLDSEAPRDQVCQCQMAISYIGNIGGNNQHMEAVAQGVYCIHTVYLNSEFEINDLFVD